MKKTVLFLLLLGGFYGAVAAAPVLPPVQAAGKTGTTARLQEFFKTYDTAVLRRLRMPVEITDDVAARSGNADIAYMQAKNSELMTLLNSIRPDLYQPSLMRADDEILPIAALIELYFELGGNNVQRAPLPWTCIKEHLLGAFSINNLFSVFENMVTAGASWSTVRPFIFQSLRRFAGWFTVAMLVYNIIQDCLL